MKKVVLSYLVIVSLVVAVGMGLSACNNTNAPERWEYMVVDKLYISSESDRQEMNQKLNQLGSEGWELVSPAANAGNTYILKRKL